VTDTDAPFAERVQSFVIGIERTAGTAFVAVWPRPGLWICEFESCRPSQPARSKYVGLHRTLLNPFDDLVNTCTLQQFQLSSATRMTSLNEAGIAGHGKRLPE
jgi:hypothetical protein